MKELIRNIRRGIAIGCAFLVGLLTTIGAGAIGFTAGGAFIVSTIVTQGLIWNLGV